MEKLQLTLTLSGATQKNPELWLRSLKLGQVLQARVVDRSLSGGLILSIGGRKITATGDFPVQKGAIIHLEVSGVYPASSLKLIDTSLPSVPLGDPLRAQYQSLVSRQGGVLAPFLFLLDPAKRVKLLSREGVKSGVLTDFLDSLSPFSSFTNPKLLRKAFLQSGLFLEAELLRMADTGGVLSGVDLKGTLFKLLNRLNPSLTRSSDDTNTGIDQEILFDLRSKLEGAIATITLNQLSTRQVNEREGCIWLFDMPFRIRDSLYGLSVAIERESAASQAHPEDQEWKIFLSVSLPGLGTIEAELFLRGQRVSVVFYLEHEIALRLLEDRLLQLRVALESRGLEVSVLRCHHGKRPSPPPKSELYLGVDEKI